MTADFIERQRRRGSRRVNDVAVRHQAQLHERLEAVANAQHKAIAILQQIAHGFGHLRRAEERRDEFRGPIGFIATREAARQHHNLAAANSLG